MYKNAGFTLMELLVVVLIIGILASVALPQYQVAVEKAKLTRLLPILRSYKDAQEVYFMANGFYADRAEGLDIAPPPHCRIGAWGHIYCSEAFYDNDVSHGNTKYYVVAYPAAYQSDSQVRQVANGYLLWLNGSSFPGETACLAQKNNTTAERVCKSFGGKKDTGRSVFFGQDVYVLPN